jgi:CRP/FNR family transcriptional regulator
MIQNFNFPKDLYPELISDFEVVHIKKKSVIVNEGDLMKKIPFIKSGAVRVYKKDLNLGREMMLYHVGPGQTCMMSIIASLRRTKSLVSAMAEEDTVLVLVPTENIRTWQSKYPTWNQFILDIFMDRYIGLLDTIHQITFGNIEERILISVKAEAGSNSQNEVMTTHQALANNLGTTRVVVSRILKKLEHQGVVQLNRGVITLLQ